jgi:hypothetical protein
MPGASRTRSGWVYPFQDSIAGDADESPNQTLSEATTGGKCEEGFEELLIKN